MDRYTKIVLTTIAVALCLQVIQRAASPARAADVLRVRLCDDVYESRCARVSSDGALSIH